MEFVLGISLLNGAPQMVRQDRSPRFPNRGFTLIEMLVVFAIISILASILFPVFSRSREKGRQTSCLSNERQLGLSVLQYAQDYDEQFPNGLGAIGGKRVWAGEGWAGQCQPYMRNAGICRCPSDLTAGVDRFNVPASYAYNINFVASPGDYGDDEDDPPPTGVSMAALNGPAHTVLMYEVSGVLVNLADSREGADSGGQPGRNYSASGNGLDNRLYGQRDWSTRIENQYETGYLGGRLPPNPGSTQFRNAFGRHNDGSNFLLADGHVHWLKGSGVSSGLNASASDCGQDNLPARPGCAGAFRAAGTGSNQRSATFSIR